MSSRALFIFTSISILLAGCNAQEYDNVTLAVTKIVNKVSNQTSTFTYGRRKLATFKSVATTSTLANMTFHFTGDTLVYITNDSTVNYTRKTHFYYSTDNTIDSTFYSSADTTFATSTRTITYNASRDPIAVQVTSWSTGSEGDIVTTQVRSELTWDGGNVTRMIIYDNSKGELTPMEDLQISYDDRPSVYFFKRPEFIYTLAPKDMFWLSTNNPVTFNDGAEERSYSYDYNKLGYPASYQSYTGTNYTVAYTQML